MDRFVYKLKYEGKNFLFSKIEGGFSNLVKIKERFLLLIIFKLFENYSTVKK